VGVGEPARAVGVGVQVQVAWACCACTTRATRVQVAVVEPAPVRAVDDHILYTSSGRWILVINSRSVSQRWDASG
jgi:hypothetical protein